MANFSQDIYFVGEDDGYVTVCIQLDPPPVMNASITFFTVRNSGNAIGLSACFQLPYGPYTALLLDLHRTIIMVHLHIICQYM